MQISNLVDSIVALCEIPAGEVVESDIISYYLEPAADIVWNRLHPYSNDATPYDNFPNKYSKKVVEVAVYIYNKRGAEGETAHNENGVNRTYESASVPESMLRDIVPFTRTL